FRRLRTSIIFSNPDLQKKTLLITSPSPSEGKTTIVVNLATVFAQADEKTIIVDADLRNPKLHNVFNVPRNNGLTEILAYENEDIAKFIHPTQVPNLHLLTCGAVPPNPSELLGSKKIEALIKKLAVIYDRIIFDTPPILAASDAVILSTKVDASIMVAKSG
ncbi:MAG: CpsD/CapB family tyrosine-protein kinase, partial [Candidatus Omnitrophica bacterium]|nr:CpsD/CapB family tyrosine-protein kinase [Candidatus Omnitrophota bacterium]